MPPKLSQLSLSSLFAGKREAVDEPESKTVGRPPKTKLQEGGDAEEQQPSVLLLRLGYLSNMLHIESIHLSDCGKARFRECSWGRGEGQVRKGRRR